MTRDTASKDGSLKTFAFIQGLWITIATAGLWLNVRDVFGEAQIDEQAWMFGITLPGTFVSIWLSWIRHWRAVLPMIAISSALHFVIYLLPLILLLGAHVNIFALREYGYAISLFALAYGCAIVAGLFLFRLTFKKETAQ